MAAGPRPRYRRAARYRVPDRPIFRMGGEGFHARVHELFLALLRHHRLPHGACCGRRNHADRADGMVGDGIFQPLPLRAHPYRRAVLAFRRRGLACGVLYLLHHAASGIEGMSDIMHMPPIRAPRRFWMGMFGACIAPIFWLGQLVLGYWVTAAACYGSDHPTIVNETGALRAMLTAFDVVA